MTSMVRAFCEAMGVVAEAATASGGCGHWLSNLMAEGRAGGQSREGCLPGSIAYRVHGAGVRFELPDGREVDLDFDPASDGPVFDAWRIRQFAESAGVRPTDVSLEHELDDAVSSGSVRLVRPGWYASGVVGT